MMQLLARLLLIAALAVLPTVALADRDSSGTYTAPVNSFNPAVTFTTIDPDDWNDILDNLEAALTDSASLTADSTLTWGAGSAYTWTFNAGAVDPVITFGSGLITISAVTVTLLDDEQELRFGEEDANGSNYIGFKAPAAITANVTCTFENDSTPIPDSCVGDGTDASGLSGLGSTDNAILRADGTGGTTAQGSVLVIADTSGAISGAASGFSIEFFGASGTDTTLTAPSAGDLNIEGNRIYRAGGTDVAVTDGGTGASSLTDLITLTTHTAGVYVAQVADGTGVDGSCNAEGCTYTPTLDLTEINTFTLGAGSATGIIFDAGATDPAIETASGSFTIDIGGTNETTLTATAFSPGVNDGNALGETSTPLRWADLFMADGGVIDIGTTASRATIAHVAASDSITIHADPDNATASSQIGFSVDSASEATLNSTNFSPGANDGNALGVSGTAWADLFLASGGLIEMDGGTSNSLTCTGGSCTIEGNTMYRAGGTDVALADGGTGASTAGGAIVSLCGADPNNDRILFWDDSAGTCAYLTPPSNFIISTTSATIRESFVIAASDETTTITAAADKVTFRMPYAFTVTAVRCSLNVAQTSGSLFTVDINEDNTSIISTKITLDNNETTSTTAATPPVISDSAIADDAEVEIDVDTVGTGSPAGLKCVLIGNQT